MHRSQEERSRNLDFLNAEGIIAKILQNSKGRDLGLRNFFKKSAILSFFRELIVYHHSSLEFRAKLLAAMIVAGGGLRDCERDLLDKISKEIYPDNLDRAEILYHTTIEYVEKVMEDNGLDLDELILDIDKELKETPRFIKKIDIKLLERFLGCSLNEEEKITRERIIDFLKDEIKEYEGKEER